MAGHYSLTAYGVLKTLAISAPTVLEAALGRLTPATCDARLLDWGRSLIDRSEVKLDIRGLENVPLDRSYIVMSNHQSHFDIPILYCVWPSRLRMVAKVELFSVPIWGRAMRAAGFVPVDRAGSRAESQAALEQAGRALQSGTNIWIAPEGTRSPDGRLGKFKKGGFRLAIATGTPIVPIALDGSTDIVPKNTWLVRRGVRVRVTVGAPIFPPSANDNDDAVSRMSGDVRAFLSAHLANP